MTKDNKMLVFGNNTILDEGILHSILIHMGGNVISYLLQFFTGIAHCHTYTSLLDDRDVVATIAERHGFIYVQAEIICMA